MAVEQAKASLFLALLRKLFLLVPLMFILPSIAGLGLTGVFSPSPPPTWWPLLSRPWCSTPDLAEYSAGFGRGASRRNRDCYQILEAFGQARENAPVFCFQALLRAPVFSAQLPGCHCTKPRDSLFRHQGPFAARGCLDWMQRALWNASFPHRAVGKIPMDGRDPTFRWLFLNNLKRNIFPNLVKVGEG